MAPNNQVRSCNYANSNEENYLECIRDLKDKQADEKHEEAAAKVPIKEIELTSNYKAEPVRGWQEGKACDQYKDQED